MTLNCKLKLSTKYLQVLKSTFKIFWIKAAKFKTTRKKSWNKLKIRKKYSKKERSIIINNFKRKKAFLLSQGHQENTKETIKMKSKLKAMRVKVLPLNKRPQDILRSHTKTADFARIRNLWTKMRLPA